MRNKVIYDINHPPGSFDKRVFIGGSFRIIASCLEEIYKAVLDCSFVPIFSLEFGIPMDETRHYAGLLVKQSKYAIFETSHDAGYFFEMEDAKNYSLKTLCLWDAYLGDNPKISLMGWSHDVFKNNNKPYSNIDDLRNHVYDFLQNN